LQVLYGKEALKAAAQRVEAAVETRNRAKIMFENGMISQGNLLDAEAALAAEELAKLNADNVLVSAVINITQLLELNPSEGFEVAVPEVQIPDQSGMALAPEAIYEAAMKTLPEFKIAEFNIKSAEKSLSISRGGRYPRLNLFGSLNTGYSNARKRLSGERVSFGDQIDENYNKSLGLSLSIPIFNSWSAHSNVKRSKLGLENVKLNDQQTRNQVYKSIVQAHSDANSGLLRYNAAQKAAAAASEAYVYAEKKYNAGMLSSVEFLNIRNNKSRAETDLLQAKYDLIFRIKVIDFYLGRPLSF
jgi:outer membrane protein